jgi:subtilisin family serine protease
MPLGSGRLEDVATTSFDPAESQAFAVRAFTDVEAEEQIPHQVEGRAVFSDTLIAPFTTCGGSPALGAVSDVRTQLSLMALHARGLDGTDVAIAIVDTGVNLRFLNTSMPGIKLDAGNSWTPSGSLTLPGKYPVGHGTMCAFDALIAAPNATLLDFPVLGNTAPGGTTVGRTLSSAMAALSAIQISWAVSFAPSALSKYRALVVNNSWGIYHPTWDFPVGHPGRYIDNPRHPFNFLITSMSLSGIDILFAAGNCGPGCADMQCHNRVTETIMGANAHPEVLTVGGCDTNDRIVGYSSQGPAIAGMFPEKPDVAAYTHFNGSETYGPGSPDSGTSTACPVAAGCVAAIRTRVSCSTTTADLFKQIRTTARSVPPQNGWQPDFGHGIIDPNAAATSLGL